MTKFTIAQALFQNGIERMITLPDGRSMLLLSVERESGNGSYLNLTGYVDACCWKKETVFVQTID
jgi:hypothetical protein